MMNAVKHNAAASIFVHNHPAGKLNLEGYDEFLGLTEKALREILEFVS